MRSPTHSNGNTTVATHKLLPNFEEHYCVRLATDTVVESVRDGVTTTVTIAPFMRGTIGPRAAQPSATTVGEAESEATVTEATIEVGRTV